MKRASLKSAQGSRTAFDRARASSLKISADQTTALAVFLSVIAIGAWGWQKTVADSHSLEVKPEAWEQVKKHFPIPEELGATPKIASQSLEQIITANPFSPMRRQKPTESSTDVSQKVPEPPKAKLIYKGRVVLGNRQRAILEDETTRKTHFLEIGQIVSGFKLLDIAEDQVIVSEESTGQSTILTLTSKTQ